MSKKAMLSHGKPSNANENFDTQSAGTMQVLRLHHWYTGQVNSAINYRHLQNMVLSYRTFIRNDSL